MNGRSEDACPERHACRESSAVCFFGLRAECGCGSRPAGVLHSTSGAPRLHCGGPAAGRPGSLELRAHNPLGPVLSDRVRASRSGTANCPRETLQGLRTPLATIGLKGQAGAAWPRSPTTFPRSAWRFATRRRAQYLLGALQLKVEASCWVLRLPHFGQAGGRFFSRSCSVIATLISKRLPQDWHSNS